MSPVDSIIVRLASASPRAVRASVALAAFALCVLFFVVLPSCGKTASSAGKSRIRNAAGANTVKVTGYCNCGKCCGWEREWIWFGTPVYSSGRLKGKPKAVGRTSTGTWAKRGTIAADPKVFPMGTVLEVPGYGRGTVEDTGGAIKGRHVDLWFPSHSEAKKWGVRELEIKILSSPSAKAGKESSKKAK